MGEGIFGLLSFPLYFNYFHCFYHGCANPVIRRIRNFDANPIFCVGFAIRMDSQGFARFFGFCESLRIHMGFAILRIPCESMDSLRIRKIMDLCESRNDSCESKHPLDSLSSRVRLLSESKNSLDSHLMRILRILYISYLKHANPGQQDSQILRTLDSHGTRIRMRITSSIMYKLYFIIIVCVS